MTAPAAPPGREEVLAAALALAAEDEERAGVAMVLALEDGAASPPAAGGDAGGDADGEALARRLRRCWEVLAGADPDVTVQDALAVLADLDVRPEPAPPAAPRAPGEPAPSLAAWRPDGWRRPSWPQRHAEAAHVVQALAGGRLLRVVNFHDTPRSHRERLRAELTSYAERFEPVSAADVHAFLDTGRWRSTRPGVVPAFYDGFASAVDVAAPLLAETGLVGWFYPPTAFLDAPASAQREFAVRHSYGVLDAREGERLAMTWDDLAALAGRHEVCGHTATHAASAAVRTAGEVEREVLEPLERLRQVCGRTPAAWAWLGGTPHDPHAAGDAAVAAAGVRLVTSNALLQRLA
ncbi:polysaccharide deacetylase family protein [Kineococcus indalonis]|uniref:polysaccharide deacetylase family protein n=1 Tax=Kineococcus indalonis TaxID=2696566 RepID=UPI0014133A3A|nr:polysaccharide deacetylase family protein [Kineococcus indalonis]NAZ86726.1 polysaccharide deacetylase family protein [Kineococcus indalonis]